MSTENPSLTSPEKFLTIIGPLFLRLVDKLLTPPPIYTRIGNTLPHNQQNNLVEAYMEAFEGWNDPSYNLTREETLEQKRAYLEMEAFKSDVLITTMGEGNKTCAFAITGTTPLDPTIVATNFANGITHIYPQLSQIPTLLKDNSSHFLTEHAIPFNDLAVIRKKLSSHLPPYVPRPVEKLLRAHISTGFLKRHLQELCTLGNNPSTPLVFWTAHVSPLLQIARQRPDSFTQQALFTPEGGEESEKNPQIYIFTTTIDRLLSMIENPFTYRSAISSEIQVPPFTYQYEPI